MCVYNIIIIYLHMHPVAEFLELGRKVEAVTMVNNNAEKRELELDAIETIWQLFDRRLRQGAISNKTGLPVPLVRAVLHGHYSLEGDKAVVDIPTMPIREGQGLKWSRDSEPEAD